MSFASNHHDVPLSWKALHEGAFAAGIKELLMDQPRCINLQIPYSTSKTLGVLFSEQVRNSKKLRSIN